MVGTGRNSGLFIRIEQHNVGIRTNSDSSLAREQAEDFGSGRRRQFYKSIQPDPPTRYPAVVNETHPVLNSRSAVRDLSEVIAAQFFLFLEAERAMVGRDHL